MRLLDLTTLYLDGGEAGVNTYLREKARYVRELRPDVEHTLILTGSSTRSDRFEDSRVEFLRNPSLPGNPSHRVLVSFRKASALLRDLKPDVVEVDCSYLLARLARRVLGPDIPIVGVIHAHLPRLYSRRVRNPLRRWFTSRTEFLSWRYSEFCAHPCDRVIATSRYVYESCAEHGYPELEHVPLGVSSSLFRPRSAAELETGPFPEIDESRPILLYVGRLSPEQDLDVLFRAHEIVCRDTDAQLVIAGEGPLEKQAHDAARASNDVVYLGPILYGTRLAELYSRATAFVMPSPNEAFGLVTLEALASGLPIVAVEQGGPKETLRDGVGILTRAADAEDFAQGIRRALVQAEDPATRTRHREYVLENYSWYRTFDRLFEIYDSLRQPRATVESAS